MWRSGSAAYRNVVVFMMYQPVSAQKPNVNGHCLPKMIWAQHMVPTFGNTSQKYGY